MPTTNESYQTLLNTVFLQMENGDIEKVRTAYDLYRQHYPYKDPTLATLKTFKHPLFNALRQAMTNPSILYHLKWLNCELLHNDKAMVFQLIAETKDETTRQQLVTHFNKSLPLSRLIVIYRDNLTVQYQDGQFLFTEKTTPHSTLIMPADTVINEMKAKLIRCVESWIEDTASDVLLLLATCQQAKGESTITLGQLFTKEEQKSLAYEARNHEGILQLLLNYSLDVTHSYKPNHWLYGSFLFSPTPLYDLCNNKKTSDLIKTYWNSHPQSTLLNNATSPYIKNGF